MSVREQIIAKIQDLPESSLTEVLRVIETIEARKASRRAVVKQGPGLLRRLQEIKIDGPRDFSRNIDLYLSGEKKVEENLS